MARLLIVDDSDQTRVAMRYLLTEHGHEIVEAENGKDALKILDQESIDLIILDLQMPIMNGRETLRRIRLKDPQKKLPVFVYSAEINDVTQTDDPELEKLATMIFAKPLNLIELLEFIHIYI